MNDRIKTICLILITLAVLVAVGFYAWSVWENLELKKIELEKRFPPKGGLEELLERRSPSSY